MNDWSHRHPGPELMDQNDIPPPDLFQNYRELDFINRWLGGYRITMNGLSKLNLQHDREVSVLDVGCGGGDLLNEVSKWGAKKNLRLKLTGIDLSNAAVEYAEKKQAREINWINENVFTHLKSGARYDVIMSTLFMHHFSEEEIVELLRLMRQSSGTGIIINDLQRNILAYQSIKVLTKFFSKSYLVKNDAPLSVLRGFRKEEWEIIFKKAQFSNVEINRRWAFRYLIVWKK